MMDGDWKDSLLGLLNDEERSKVEENMQKRKAAENCQHLKVAVEKRGGKKVSIIYGFMGSEAALKELAATLKSKLAAGGSVRDGEILIQGDLQQKIKKLLQEMGHKC